MNKRPTVTKCTGILYRSGELKPVARKLAKCGLHLVEVQEIRWDVSKRLYYPLFCRQENENHE